MAYALKYRYEWDLITASSTSWDAIRFEIHKKEGFDANDGPIYLEGQGDPIGPAEINFPQPRPGSSIAPCEILFNLFNRRYASNEIREIVDEIDLYRDIVGDGSGGFWVCSSGGIEFFSNAEDTTPTNQTTGSFRSIDSAATNKLATCGNSSLIKTTSDGVNWTTRTSWDTGQTFFSIIYALDDITVLACAGEDAGGNAQLGRSVTSGSTWTDYDAKVSGIGKITSLSLPLHDDLFFVADTNLYKITTFSTVPSNASQISLPDNADVDIVTFLDSLNGIVFGNGVGFITSNGGSGASDWTKIINPIPVGGSALVCHYVASDLILLIGADNEFYFSSNGINWQNVPRSAAITGAMRGVFYESNKVMICTTLGEYCSFYITDRLTEFEDFNFKDYIVYGYRGDGANAWTEFWHGFLDPSFGYVEPHEGNKSYGVQIQLRAVDGFGKWQSEEYLTSGGVLETGRTRIHDIIQDGLKLHWTKSDGEYMSYVDFRADEFSGADWTPDAITDALNPFKQAYVDKFYFRESTNVALKWYEVISGMIKSFDAEIRQAFYKYGWPRILNHDRHITSTAADTQKFLRYQIDSDSALTPDNRDEEFTRGLDTDGYFQGALQVFSEKIKYVEATVWHGRPKMLARRYNFELEDWQSSSVLNADFEIVGTPTLLKVADTEDFSLYSLQISSTTNPLSAADTVIFPRSSAEAVEGSTLCIHFRVLLTVTDSAPGSGKQNNPAFYIKIRWGNKYLWDGTTNKPANQSDLTSLQWTAQESWITIEISGDNMGGWMDFNFGKISWGFPAVVPDGGTFEVSISEVFTGSYSYVSFRYDEFYVFVLDRNGKPAGYDDIRVEVENTTLSEGERINLGRLFFYDFPRLDFIDYSASTFADLEIDFNGPTWTNGDLITFKLDGTTHTFTFQSSPGAVGSKDFNNTTRFIQEIYFLSNNYYVRETQVNEKVKITAFDLVSGSKSFSPITINDPSGDWTEVHVADVLTIDEYWLNPASITEDDGSSPSSTSPTSWNWHINGQSEAKQLWQLALERYLQRHTKPTHKLVGKYWTNEADDMYGGMMGLIPSGETNYKFAHGSCDDMKKLEWNITTERYESGEDSLTAKEIWQ